MPLLEKDWHKVASLYNGALHREMAKKWNREPYNLSLEKDYCIMIGLIVNRYIIESDLGDGIAIVTSIGSTIAFRLNIVHHFFTGLSLGVNDAKRRKGGRKKLFSYSLVF